MGVSELDSGFGKILAEGLGALEELREGAEQGLIVGLELDLGTISGHFEETEGTSGVGLVLTGDLGVSEEA